MSFLYDPKIYSQLLKTSQVTTGPVVDTNNISLAKKLVNRLSRELTNVTEPPNLTSNAPADLMVNNLRDLSELLKFIDLKNLMIDGKRIAYNGKDAQSLPKDELDKLSKITIDVSRNEDDPNLPQSRQWNTSDYWADMPALIKYVAYLQQKAKSMQEKGNDSGKVLEVMVGKIIDQINAYKPNSGLSRKPKSQPGQPNELPDDTFIDGIVPKVFDISAPISVNKTATSPEPLKAKDLKNKVSLNAWLADAKVITVDPKGVKFAPLDYSDQNADQCVVINVLYNRAKYLVSRASTDVDEKAANYYLKKIQELGPSFTGVDGKACTVGSIGAGSNSGANAGNSGGAASGTSGVVESVKRSVEMLPLKVEDINFDRIQSFFRQYENVTSSAGAKGAINQCESVMADLRQMLKNKNQSIFSLGADPATVANWIGLVPPGRYYSPLIDKLSEVIELTGQVIMDLKAAYADSGKLSKDPNLAAYVYGQIGRSPEDNSFYTRNINQLRLLKSQVNQVNRIGT